MNTPSKLRKAVVFGMFLIVSSVMLVSCGSDDPEPNTEPTIAEQTVFMYCPWAGGGSIYTAVKKNITDFEKAIVQNKGLDGRKLIVFVSQNKNQSCLINITYNNNSCVRDTLKTYDFSALDYTTANGLSSILNDVKQTAPAKAYSMIIGAHGMGWLPAGKKVANRMAVVRKGQNTKRLTRYFGDPDNSEYMTDIATLAEGITAAGMKMKYILFDDCYMSNIETAYDLKDVTEYLIASPCEVLMDGFPYETIGKALLVNNYKEVCDGFYNYYADSYGTIGITDCGQVEAMARIMKTINQTYPNGLQDVQLRELQSLDGCTPTIFFDFADYADKLCEDEDLKAEFNAQMDRLVVYKGHTDKFVAYIENETVKEIKTFSGLTISDPTKNTQWGAKTDKLVTSWYKATH